MACETITMERISSAGTRWVKLGIPILCFAVLATVALQALKNGPPGTTLPTLVIVGFAAVLVTVICLALLAKLADEVLDHGTHLIVRRGTRRASIELKQIRHFGYSALASPRTVWLRLEAAGPFGREISFVPKGASFGFGVPAVVTALRQRVRAARPNAGSE